jgi:DNA mismatch endonuclease (patch repair protein)
MRSVNRTNTSPEMLVRKFLHKQGLRFRLHNKDLPGTPDIVLPRHKTVVFVHGCFWHRHTGCSKATTPKTRLEFWNNKFTKNVKRDGENERILRQLGWQVLVVWECATKSEDDLVKALNPLFENDKKYGWTEAGQGK